MNIHMIKATVMGLLLALTPVTWAQGSASHETVVSKFPKQGVRFVICDNGSFQLPTPLYVKVGKEYLPIEISRRMPSPRLAPESGKQIKFYDTMPTSTKNGKADKIEPVLTITIPDGYASGKSVCIVQPAKKDDGDVRTIFLKESEFKLGGVYIVNFTNSELEMITDPTGKFDEKSRITDRIKPREKTQNLSVNAPNVWRYHGKVVKTVVYQGKKIDRGEAVPFILQARSTTPGKEPVRIKASTFLTNENMSQINVVVNHSRLKNAYELLSVQFSDESKLDINPNKPTH